MPPFKLDIKCQDKDCPFGKIGWSQQMIMKARAHAIVCGHTVIAWRLNGVVFHTFAPRGINGELPDENW
jgi:hypothetical protein